MTRPGQMRPGGPSFLNPVCYRANFPYLASMDEPLTAGEPLVPLEPSPVPGAPEPAPARKRRRRRRRHWVFGALRGLMGALVGLVLAACVAGAAGGWMVYRHFAEGLPDVDGLRGYQPPVMSRVFANDGRLLADLATERRIFVPVNAIPEIVRQAFVSAEDRNFYSHKGVDPLAVLRAAATNLTQRDGRRPIGASTITQQVAKNMLLDNEVTFARKAKEAILAFRIEKTLSKDQILELYLNEIYLGLGSYGVASAAETYFNKTLDQLTVGETAFLAALPKAPNNYNPFRYPDAARAQRARVLDRMTEDRVLTAEEAARAKQEPIVPVAFRRPQVVSDADWFAEDVRRQLIAQFGPDTTTEGGLSVRTSLDPVLQTAANKALRNGLIAYDHRLGGWRGPVAHIDDPSLERDWPTLLVKVPHKPGMLPTWHLAVVLTTSDNEARVAWLSGLGVRGATPQTNLGEIPMSDVTWARPLHGDDLGPAPKRITDVMRTGDVVMIEPAQAVTDNAAKPAETGVKPGSALPRVTLRQIPGVQGALICMDPTTGRVLAMVGGFSFEQSQFNRATQAMRQPGSSFKPMVYLTALEAGISPNQMISNSELSIQVGNTLWEPENSTAKFGAPVSVKTALQFSMNVPTVRLAQKIGMTAIAKTAQAFHMYDNLPHMLSAALGSVETTPMREIGAYAGIAVGGKEVIPTLIDSVQDRNGRIVWRPHDLECPACSDPKAPPAIMDMRKQIADPYADRTLIDLMENVVTGGTGRAAGAGFNRPIAGKTGTTQDWGDAWFSGFTPDLVTTVWIGYDNNYSLGRHEEGGVVAAPIWHEFMVEAFKGRPVLNFPQAAGPRIAFAPPENRMSESVIGSGSGRASGDSSGAVHGGVDNKLGGLY
jgi:penicillin-binding protein 1A